MNQSEILSILNVVLEKRGKSPISAQSNENLREYGFRSMDFSEVALRVEEALGKEIVFDASILRKIESFQDVLEFFRTVTN